MSAVLQHIPAPVDRDESVERWLVRSSAPAATVVPRGLSGRAWFLVGTIAIHVLALVGLLNAQRIERVLTEPESMVVSLIDAPTPSDQPAPSAAPTPSLDVMLAPPPDIVIDSEPDTTAPTVTLATNAEPPTSDASAAPVVESVDYVVAPAPVYPSESSRRRERGTVLLRVLVDAMGRPAQVVVEHSSGYPRLDDAARAAVLKALFRPHEINGVARAAQVLIPIEFTRRSS